MPLGLTIRIGAGVYVLSSPEGVIDLAPLSRRQREDVAALIAEAMGLGEKRRPVRKRRPPGKGEPVEVESRGQKRRRSRRRRGDREKKGS
jgi:hypothetical protein